MRTTHYYKNGKWYEKGSFSTKPQIYVIGDEMAPSVHPVNQEVYDSKSEFRKVTKAAGYVEMGNEYVEPSKPQAAFTPFPKAFKEAMEYHQTIAGKSESERKEIKERFFNTRPKRYL